MFPEEANSAVPMGLNMFFFAPSPGDELPGYFQSPLWGSNGSNGIILLQKMLACWAEEAAP